MRYFSFNRESKLALALGLFAIVASACHPTTVPAAPFYSAQVAPGLWRGAQPHGQADLASIGFAGPLCIDIRLSGDGEGGVSWKAEGNWAIAFGCSFLTIHVGYPITSADELREAAVAVEGFRQHGRVFTHCVRGIDRTGGVIAAWELLYTAKTRAEVFHEMNLWRSDVDRAIDIESTAALAEIARRVGK